MIQDFESIKLLNSKWQPPNRNNLWTKAEFSNEEVGVKKWQNFRRECCEVLLLSKEYTFKNVNKTFTLKAPMSCSSFNVFYAITCSGCLKEYMRETVVGKIRLMERIGVYKQYIKQSEHQKLKVEENIRICGRDSFKIFLFLQMQSNKTNIRGSYEAKFQTEYKLNSINFDRLKVWPEL